jgi:hypothetical protein
MYYVCVDMYPRQSREEVTDSGPSLNTIMNNEENRKKKAKERKRTITGFITFFPLVSWVVLCPTFTRNNRGLERRLETGVIGWRATARVMTTDNPPVRS